MATGISSQPAAKPFAGRVPVRIGSARSPDEVDALEPAWRELGSRLAVPLAQFDWARACISAFPPDAMPHVVAAYAGGRMVAVAPLVKKRLHGVGRLFLAGASELSEPMDLAWTDERALARLIRSLARGGSPLSLERIPADSPSLKVLRRIYRGRAVVITRHRAACPYIALDESWLEPRHHLQLADRVDYEHARRNAEQRGHVTTEICSPDLGDLAEHLDLALDVEARGARGDWNIALAGDAHRAVFYRQFAQAACVDGLLRICFLRVGDRAAAMQLAVEQGGGFWLLAAGADARFAECAPGMLLAHDTIRYAVEARLSTYEFLSTASAEAAAWTSTKRPQVAVSVYPLGVRGISALATDLVAAAMRRWHDRAN